ncbi:hypothetical protein GIB67_014825, partial [Kingdonia uniflora]
IFLTCKLEGVHYLSFLHSFSSNHISPSVIILPSLSNSQQCLSKKDTLISLNHH